MKNYFKYLPITNKCTKITRTDVLFTGHIGGGPPTNGTTYNKKQ